MHCRDCGEFTEGELYIEIGTRANCGFYGGAFYKELRCEYCGSDDLEDAEWCSVSGDWITEEDCRECPEDCKI